MAGIARETTATETDNIEILKRKYEEVKLEISNYLKGKPDRNKLSEEDKKILRFKYSTAASYAYELSHRMLTNPEMQEKYKDDYKKLSEYVNVETGVFGSDMLVSITNDGPITIIIESGD